MLFETVGLLLLVICIPEHVCNRINLLQLDNIAVKHAWKKKIVKNDELTSILIMWLHLIEYALPCKIFIEHIQRRTTKNLFQLIIFLEILQSKLQTEKASNTYQIPNQKVL